MVDSEIVYTIANDDELDALLSGGGAVGHVPWTSWGRQQRMPKGTTGVFCRVGRPGTAAVQPLAIVPQEDDMRRLFSRYAQLRGELSPLSAWCHILPESFLRQLGTYTTRTPELLHSQAAWAGLTVAEAVLRAERPLNAIKLSSCLSTNTFAIARTLGLWGAAPLGIIIQLFDSAARICRPETSTGTRHRKIREALEPIWTVLNALSQGTYAAAPSDVRPLVLSLEHLHSLRSQGIINEPMELAAGLIEDLPEARLFETLPNQSAESRLRMFDSIILGMDEAQSPRRRNALGMLAGYLATVAAGGLPSLGLAERVSFRHPEVLAWAYLIGGIGERVTWTSSFDGLGRLVSREIMRPFRLDDAPTCDFALSEADFIVDTELSDPLVRLRVKQARIANVSLLPGVNVPYSYGDLSESPKSDSIRAGRSPAEAAPSSANAFDVLADAIWPRIREKIDEYFDEEPKDSSRRPKKRRPGQQGLPLPGPKK